MNDKVTRAKAAVTDAEARMKDALDAIEAASDDISDDDLSALNATFDEAEADVNRCKSELEREERIAAARAALPAPAPAAVTVGEEEPVYRRDTDRSWFQDLFAAKSGDSEAIRRLHTNNKQVRDAAKARGETRANATGTGFLPPIYLGSEWANIPHPARNFVNNLPRLDLPSDGMTFTIPVVSGATSVDTHQDGGNVSDTAATTTTVSHTLVAIAGQNEIDRVVLERSFPGLDMVIFDDLRRLYDTQIGVQSFTGSGSSGQHLGLDNVSGIISITYTDSSPTGLKLLQQAIYPAISKMYSQRYMAPSAIVMHPRRAAWLASTSDSTYPLFNQGGLGTFQLGQQDKGIVGTIAGLPVIADANVPTTKGSGTNQDTIYVVRLEDFLFGEEGVQSATFEEVVSSTLAIRLQLWGYSLLALDRYPTAIVAVNGSGLAAPTNF
jgi:HK97 family phage major capsid protein